MSKCAWPDPATRFRIVLTLRRAEAVIETAAIAALFAGGSSVMTRLPADLLFRALHAPQASSSCDFSVQVRFCARYAVTDSGLDCGAEKIPSSGNGAVADQVAPNDPTVDRQFGRSSMANPRQAEKQPDQEMKHAAQEMSRKLADDTSRAARTAADAGAGAARAGADMLQRNAETMQYAWQSGNRMASHFAEQSIERLTRAFGGGESAQQASEQSSRNLESIVQSGT